MKTGTKNKAGNATAPLTLFLLEQSRCLRHGARRLCRPLGSCSGLVTLQRLPSLPNNWGMISSSPECPSYRCRCVLLCCSHFLGSFTLNTKPRKIWQPLLECVCLPDVHSHGFTSGSVYKFLDRHIQRRSL